MHSKIDMDLNDFSVQYLMTLEDFKLHMMEKIDPIYNNHKVNDISSLHINLFIDCKLIL